jgi:transcriptional regulator with XRE-family HTH domain
MAMLITDKQDMLLGLRVATEMRRQGLSIPQLVARSGVTLSTVQKICGGAAKRTSVWTIWALAHALGVSLDYLVGDTTRRRTAP